jgi:UDP-galactopyranose mutase
MKQYDYIIVGSGIYGATFANLAKADGKKVLVIDRRDHIGGNAYTRNFNGINVHVYGAHIFHTSDEEVRSFVNHFASFNNFQNHVLANYKGKLYNLPFNMYTFEETRGVKTPEEAKKIIAEQVAKENIKDPKNLEEQALSLVGRDIYEKLIKGYTEKQRGRKATELPPFIIKRLPLRFEYNNNYFNDVHQGIPIGGYTAMIKKMLEGIEVILNTDFLKNKDYYLGLGEKIIYTGPIDEYYEYKFGELAYRSLRFELEIIDQPKYQDTAVVNYTEYEVPYTRIIEHKRFEGTESPKTVITREYPAEYDRGQERYYPVNDEENNELYKKYAALAQKEGNVFFGGRLGKYRYFDMDDTVKEAMSDYRKIASGN